MFTYWFFLVNVFKKFFQEITIKVSNNLDPDQAWRFVGPNTICKGYQERTLEGK